MDLLLGISTTGLPYTKIFVRPGTDHEDNKNPDILYLVADCGVSNIHNALYVFTPNGTIPEKLSDYLMYLASSCRDCTNMKYIIFLYGHVVDSYLKLIKNNYNYRRGYLIDTTPYSITLNKLLLFPLSYISDECWCYNPMVISSEHYDDYPYKYY
jgi:hypothetical protein